MTFDATRGLVHLESPHSVPETLTTLENVLRSKGIPVLTRIDHSGDAARVGLHMNPAELLIFGNPKAGTPLMLASPTSAIDLPLKALAWQDEDGKGWLPYNTPEYLAERHSVPKELLENIAVIALVCEAAVKP